MNVRIPHTEVAHAEIARAQVMNMVAMSTEAMSTRAAGTAVLPPEDGGAAALPDYVTALKARVGSPLGTSDWVTMDQQRIDRFAEATGDYQFVHVDPVRAAAETPFGGTIAHGYLTLSMVGTFATEVMPPHPAVRMMVNMGADKVRLLGPVRVNQRIRGVFVLSGVSALPDRKAALRARVTIEVEDVAGSVGAPPVPVLTADLSLMLVLADPVAAGADLRADVI